MSEEKHKSGKSSEAEHERSAKTGGAVSPTAVEGPEPPSDTVPAQVQQRQARYLIAPRSLPGQIQPMAIEMLQNAINELPDVRIIKRLRRRGLGAFSADAPGGSSEVLVTEMNVERGEALRQSAPPQVIVERDELLHHHGEVDTLRLLPANIEATALPSAATAARIKVRIVDRNGQALPGTSVIAYGQAFPAQGTTDRKGEAELQLDGPVETVRALYVKPPPGRRCRTRRQPFHRRSSMARGGRARLRGCLAE